MISKPDPDHLCDEFGTGFDIADEMCPNCDSMDFCWDLHEKIKDWVVWATKQDRIANENGWGRRYLK